MNNNVVFSSRVKLLVYKLGACRGKIEEVGAHKYAIWLDGRHIATYETLEDAKEVVVDELDLTDSQVDPENIYGRDSIRQSIEEDRR